MEIDARIGILINSDVTRIEITDRDSGITFCRIELTPDQICRLLSREVGVECKKAQLYNLENVGKKLEIDTLKFQLTDDVDYGSRYNIAKKLAIQNCPKGWEPSLYFNSQDSFFIRDENQWARCSIRRWVDKE